MLSATNIRRLTLGPLDLTLQSGEVVALQGESGSGKTLLMRALADLDPCEGDVTLNGTNREAISGPDWRKSVAWVPAEAGWWAETIHDHFAEPDKAVPLMGELGLPGDCLSWPVARASTGERQRLALIRAVIQDPKVLLLDEPTSGLDSTSVSKVEALVTKLAGDGAAVLWVTHDDAQYHRVGSRYLRISGGKLHAERS